MRVWGSFGKSDDSYQRIDGPQKGDIQEIRDANSSPPPPRNLEMNVSSFPYL